MRLTEERRGWVEQNLDVARIVAFRCRSRLLDRDERLSVAYHGLCLAAIEHDPRRGGTYRSFAYHRARSRLLDELDRARIRSMARIDGHPSHDPRPTPADLALARELIARFGRLSPRERRVIELYMEGLSWAEIARALRLTHSTVLNYRRRVAEKLLRPAR